MGSSVIGKLESIKEENATRGNVLQHFALHHESKDKKKYCKLKWLIRHQHDFSIFMTIMAILERKGT